MINNIEQGRLIEIGKRLFTHHIPSNTQALIIAENHVDCSDSMTDYFAHTTSKMVIVGYSSHTRDMFSEMRKAALSLPETMHLGPGKGHFEPRVVASCDFLDSGTNGRNYFKGQYSPWHRKLMEDEKGHRLYFQTMAEAEEYTIAKGEPREMWFDDKPVKFVWKIEEQKIEHREKYSMGSGYYLKDGHSNSSGWCVKKYKKWNDRWSDEVYVSIAERCIFAEKRKVENIPETTKPKAVDIPEKVTVSGVTVKRNEEKNGIEISFLSKPDQKVIDNLKSHGWRWSRFNMVWYNKDIPRNMEFAQSLVGESENNDIPDHNVPDQKVNIPREKKTKPSSDMALKLRTLADGMEKAIDGKFNSGVSQQNPTARRMRIAEGMRKDGEQLRKVQYLLRTLADMHENGNVPKELAHITSKAAAHTALFDYRDKVQSAIDLSNTTPGENPKEKALRDLDRELIGCKIPGFFVTPKPIAERIVELADIREGMDVLEPSAGRGNIAECVNHGSSLTCIEYQQKLAGILRLRGFDTICGDFLEHTGSYDRIVANPPFENFQDIKHIRHAYQCLKDGGRLVSIMGEGAFFRSDKVPSDFREWLKEVNAEIIDLPAGSFSGTITSTGVKTRIVVIDK